MGKINGYVKSVEVVLFVSMEGTKIVVGIVAVVVSAWEVKKSL